MRSFCIWPLLASASAVTLLNGQFRPPSLQIHQRHPGARLSEATLAIRASEAQQVAAWVAQSGGQCDAVRVTASDKGLGLVAAKDVRRGDDLLSVPLSLGLTTETVLRSSIGAFLADFEPELGDYAFIAIALLHERRLGDQSELAPWMSATTLLPPGGFGDLPPLWEGDELAELAGATTAGAAARRAAIQADFEWLEENVFETSPVVFPPFVFTLEAYTAAVAVAISRCVTGSGDDAYDEVPMLVPMLDLPNHEGAAPSATAQARAEKGGLFGGGGTPACAVLVATRDVNAGEPVCLRYDGETSGQLLLDYGFLEEPVEPVAMFTFELDENDRFLDEKLDVLEQAGFGFDNSWLIGEDAPPPGELIAFLRLKNLNAADAFLLEPVFIDAIWSEHLQLPVSKENEEAALNEGAQRCAAALATLTGSVQADLAVLAEAERSSREYALAAVRYAERRAVQSAERWFALQLSGLTNLEYYQERRLSAMGLQPIETEDELDALRAVGDRAGGRRYGANDYKW